MRTLIAIAAGVLLLTSCLEVEQVVTLNKDGSGTQRLKLSMTERSLSAARSRAALDASQDNDPTRVFDARLVRRELTDAGLVCKSIDTSTARRRRVLEVDAEFASVTQLKKSPLSGDGAEWDFGPGEKKGTIRATFYPRGLESWKAAKTKAVELAANLGDRENEYFNRAKSQMKGLQIRWVMNLPGPVVSVSSNLRKVSANQVSATITETDVKSAKDLVQLLAPRFEVVFDGRDCTFGSN